jgi:hypothetical membrane protein
MFRGQGKMNSKQPMMLKVAGFCGMLFPFVFFICISLAIYYSPWFSWTENWLSDMNGVIYKNNASVFFNAGFIISGIIGFVFAVTIRKTRLLTKGLGRLGALLLILDMSALCAIGIFQTGHLHTLVANTFFFMAGLSLIPIGIALRKSSEKTLGGFITLLGVFSLCSLPFLSISQPWGSNAVAEMFPIISISVFAIIVGTKLLKDKFDLKD